MKAVKKQFKLIVEWVIMLWKKIGEKVRLTNNEIISCISCRFLVSGKYIALQICDDEDVETMIESFVEAMSSKVILMMPKNQELSKFQRFKNQVSRIKIQDSRIKFQESRFKNQ